MLWYAVRRRRPSDIRRNRRCAPVRGRARHGAARRQRAPRSPRPGGSPLTPRVPVMAAARGPMFERLTQLGAAAVDAAAHRAELDAESRGDLFVRQSLDV